MTITTSAANRVQQLHTESQRQYESIRGNGDLSDEARYRQLAQAYVGYRDGLNAARDDEDSARAQRVSALTRQAFGAPPASDPLRVMSYRDAQARAGEVDNPQVAHARMVMALDTGDTLLAQALAAHASQSGWRTVTEAYGEAVPSAGQVLGELAQLQAPPSAQERFNRTIVYSASKPEEFRDLDEFRIERMAAQQ